MGIAAGCINCIPVYCNNHTALPLLTLLYIYGAAGVFSETGVVRNYDLIY
jgi:hypothetical protein